MNKLLNQFLSDTEIVITSHGNRNLGAAIGSNAFIQEFVQKIMNAWKKEIKELAKIAVVISQPQAALAAFQHGMCNTWAYMYLVLFQVVGSSLNQLRRPSNTSLFLPLQVIPSALL